MGAPRDAVLPAEGSLPVPRRTLVKRGTAGRGEQVSNGAEKRLPNSQRAAYCCLTVLL